MDLFRSKKRGTETASLGEVPESLQKRHRNMTGSVGDLLEAGDDSQDEVFSDLSTSESENDDIQKASKMQKIFAKKLIKRDKRKEKEQRRKAEKNLISMDDFLRKQSEFKMWLYEEKSKNAGTMSSPKLKVYFKQFVRVWNKHKLLPKYYKSSTLPDSPRTPLTPKEFNFLSEDPMAGSGQTDNNCMDNKKGSTTSPFVTFGKTPPKVFKSKKLQLFGSSHDVALISVAPLESNQNTAVTNKENPRQTEPCQYRVPSVKSRKQSINELDTPSPQFIGATPYKVSVFSWAMGDSTDCDANQSLEVCPTETPPNLSHAGQSDPEDWPPPPTETELNCQSTSDSPHVPPPPPPRIESLPKSGYDAMSVKSDGSDYSDPYDKLPDRSFKNTDTCAYQDPVDCIINIESKKRSDVRPEGRLVLKSFSSTNDEPYYSMYSKPVVEKRPSKEELEEMYAKPIKKHKKAVEQSVKNEHSADDDGMGVGLYAEIMAHLDKKEVRKKSEDKCNIYKKSPEPHYESIDDLLRVDSKVSDSDNKQSPVNKTGNVIEEMKRLQEFAGLAKNKKKTVLAASSDKIYETYLSHGRKVNQFKNKVVESKVDTGNAGTSTLKKRHLSQPDISFSDTMQIYDKPASVSGVSNTISKEKPVLSSFKHIDYSYGQGKDSTGLTNLKLSQQQKSISCEDNLGMVETPRTPTIMSTPSFESLCRVTPLSHTNQHRSQSSQSLPTKSASSDNLSSCDSFMSSSTSSVSIEPSDFSGSLQSLLSERSLPSVPEEVDDREIGQSNRLNKPYNTKKHDLSAGAYNKTDKWSTTGMIPSTQAFSKPDNCVLPVVGGSLTPGKANSARHGIDLSVYLLKPNNQNGQNDIEKKVEHVHGTDKSNTGYVNNESSTKINCKSKTFDTQSRLAFKETLSGLKTKVDPARTGNIKETERRQTVQTIQEMKEGYIIHKKPDNPNHLPNNELVAKVSKTESSNKSLKSKWKGETVSVGTNEPDSKRHCGEKVACKKDIDQYLETDLDSVFREKPKPVLRKSKSHSGFGSLASSNVVTDIW